MGTLPDGCVVEGIGAIGGLQMGDGLVSQTRSEHVELVMRWSGWMFACWSVPRLAVGGVSVPVGSCQEHGVAGFRRAEPVGAAQTELYHNVEHLHVLEP